MVSEYDSGDLRGLHSVLESPHADFTGGAQSGDVRLLRETLVEEGEAPYEFRLAANFVEAQQCLLTGTFDLMLCDLTLPGLAGLATFRRLHEFMPDVPIIVLSALRDEALAVQAVQEGAQDYLVKGVDLRLLPRAMRYAVERHRLQQSLRNLSLTDELTGLYNRRGFFTLAERQLKFAARAEQGMLLLFADLDGMKGINDTFGHHIGDQALRRTAELLKATLRESDLIARLGGDEFVILAMESRPDGGDSLKQRLRDGIAISNAGGDTPFQLSLSLGIIRFDPQYPRPLHEMLASADGLMYQEKRAWHARHAMKVMIGTARTSQ